jgi:DNA-binding MarR family transcriptional regulator
MNSSNKHETASQVWQLMSHFATAQFREKAAKLREQGLTPGHLKAILSLEPGESRPMGACASELGCDASTATWLVDRLEDRGLVERRPSTTDRRVKAVVLTQRGAKVRAQLQKHYSEPPAALLDLDQEVLEDMLRVLLRVTSEVGAPAGKAQ